MEIEEKQLKNKLNTLFINSPGSTSASVQIWFRAGSALEEKENQGIAHFLEHMFFKGTPTRPGSKIAHEVESYGGEINAFTSFDYTCYYINCPHNKINKTVEILMDMVSNPQFKVEDLLPERDVVFEEYRRSIDSPGNFAFSKMQNSCFNGGYKHQILGTEKTIKNFTREQLQDFRNKYYNLSNSMLIVTGDLKDQKKTETTIEKFKLPEGTKSKFQPFHLSKSSKIDVHKKDIKTAMLNFAIEAPSFINDSAPAEDLAFNCLGHGESSRLNSELVLKSGIANSVSSSTMFMSNGGVHLIRVYFPYENLDKVLSEVKNIIKVSLAEGLNESEIKRIQNIYTATKVYEMESVESFAFYLGHGFAQNGDIYCEEKFIEQVRKTSPSKVSNALKTIFVRPTHLSLQIPENGKISACKQKLAKFSKDIKNLATSKSQTSKSKYKVTKSKFDPQVQVVSLKKGINLIYRKNELTPTFVLHSYIVGGLSHENKNNNGIHALIASTITLGFGKKTSKEIINYLEDRSATLHGFAGKNSYGLTMHGQSEHFTGLAEHFMGSLLEAEFPAKEIKREKELTNRSLQNQVKDPVKLCFKQISELFFNDHPYSQNMLGSKKTLSKLNRKNLLSHHQKNIKNNEIVFTYCGDLDLEEVISNLEPHIKKLPTRNKKSISNKNFNPKLGKSHHITFDREQSQIFIGFPTAKLGSKENLYLKMIYTWLSGQSSRLFVSVRDQQGLCYSTQPVHFTALETGYFGIYMASGHDKVERAIKAIHEILDDVKNDALEEKEFNRIKQMIQGQMALNIQVNEDYANIYSVPVLQGFGLDFYYKKNDATMNLNYADFKTNIKKIFNRKRTTVVVGKDS
jgi:zinc protease